MERSAFAVWQGGLKEGKGTISLASGAMSNSPYSFSTRFAMESGTNPEELIAAAHAGCFSMAVAKEFQDAGFSPERISTKATVTLNKEEGGFAITASALTLEAVVPGITKDAFAAATQAAKVGCPVSKLLKAEISLNAKLVEK